MFFILRCLVKKVKERRQLNYCFFLVPQMSYHWVAYAKNTSILLIGNWAKIHFSILYFEGKCSITLIWLLYIDTFFNVPLDRFSFFKEVLKNRVKRFFLNWILLKIVPIASCCFKVKSLPTCIADLVSNCTYDLCLYFGTVTFGYKAPLISSSFYKAVQTAFWELLETQLSWKEWHETVISVCASTRGRAWMH